MNQGYLIYASGQAYIQQAVLCAMSILVHNPKAAISLVTDTAITNPVSYTHLTLPTKRIV